MADKIKHLPFPVYFWSVAGTGLAGLLVSLYLSISHFRVHTDILYASFCAVSKAINCDTVSQSPYSILLDVPVPVWGVVGYSFFLILLFFAKTKPAGQKRLWSLLIATSCCFTVYSLILAYISRYYIKSYCIMCIVSYGINFLLLYSSWLVRRRFSDTRFVNDFKKDIHFLQKIKKKCIYAFTPLFIITGLLLLFFPNYWNFEYPDISSDIKTGITEDQSPWIGAENPELVITEFTDYMCFQCRKSHFYLRKIISQYPDKIRLVHKHFPMDQMLNPIVTDSSFHAGAGKLAIASAYAALEGRFWQMNDLLYDLPKGIKTVDIKDLAQKSGVQVRGLAFAPEIKALRYKVKYDVAKGIRLGITGTPSYVVNGKVYQGRIPVKVIKNALEQ